MIPILYASVTEGSVPTNYGVGALTDCLSCKVTEARNGRYELTLEYTVNGIHAEDIEVNRFIKAKPNFNDNPQLFRIYKVGKVLNGRFTVNAQHISYDLSGKIASSGDASSCQAACILLSDNYAGNFTVTTDKLLNGAFSIDEPSSVKSWFGGKQGSILDVFGPGEWHYDNYTCTFKANRGTDRGVSIRYGKNLTELSQEISIENLVTGVLPYAKNDELGTVAIGTKAPTGLTLDVPRDVAIDFSNDVNWEDGTPVETQLTLIALDYVSRHTSELINLTDNITLGFAQLNDLAERIDLCDTVHIYYEALGISKSAKCIEATWDVLNDRYSSNTFGDPKGDISDSLSQMQERLETTPTQSEVVQTVSRATELITGNLGGYVILHDTDNDGKPDEILITNDEDYLSATEVWRWNKNGLGFATSYAGPYDTAITADGKINANFLKVGTITDVAGNSSIDMTSGIAHLYQLEAISSFQLVDGGGDVHASLEHNSNRYARMYLGNSIILTGKNSSFDGQGGVIQLQTDNEGHITLTADEQTGGHIEVDDVNGHSCVQISSETYPCIIISNHSNNPRFTMFVGGNDDGVISIADTNNNETINLAGLNGVGNFGTVKARDNQWVELYNGSLTPGNAQGVDWKYNTFLVVGRVTSGGSLHTMTIPRAMINANSQQFCFADEANWVTFSVKYEDDPLYGEEAIFTFGGRSSNGLITKIYGNYV